MKYYGVLKYLVIFIFITLIVFATGWVRIQGIVNIPEGQFTSNDAYLYYWQADLIAKHGMLPVRDMHRWLPLGRDHGQTLNLYSYVTVYAYKLVTFFFPNVTLYQVCFFAPVVCFMLGVSMLCLFLYRTFGIDIALIVGVLLAVLPGSVERSSAGFSDRDSWCWLLGVLTVITYLWKEQSRQGHYRFVGTALSGFFMLIGGLSWEGFGIFGLIILAVELWRFLITETEEYLTEYMLWVFMFAPWLYLFSPAYHRGEGFSTHLAALVIFPPLVILVLRHLRLFLIRYTRISNYGHGRFSGRAIASVLTAGCFLLGTAYIFSQRVSFADSTVPFSDSRLMQTVGELLSPNDAYWRLRYGSILLLSVLGIVGGCVRLWGKYGAFLAATLCLLTLSTFFREHLYLLLSPLVCEYLFYTSIAFTPIAALGAAALRKLSTKNEFNYIALIVWLFYWMGLARGAKRYDFFIGFPLAFFAAACIRYITAFLTGRLEKYVVRNFWMQPNNSPIKTPPTIRKKGKRTGSSRRKPKPIIAETPKHNPLILQPLLKTGITVLILTILLFWQPPVHTEPVPLAKRSILILNTSRRAMPGRDTAQGIAMEKALQWLKAEFADKENAVVASEWSSGSILNVLGGVKTIIDQDHFIHHWIYLYNRHVFCAQSEHEALEFLKAHNATHLLLTGDEIRHPQGISSVGSNENLDRQFEMVPMAPRSSISGFPKYRLEPTHKNTPIKFIDINFAKQVVVTAQLKTGEKVRIPYITTFNERHIEKDPINESNHGGILHHFNKQTQRDTIFYIPSIGWNSLAVKLFLHGEHSDAFVPVYPESDGAAEVKIWEIHYPPDITENPKYLEIAPHTKRSQ